MFVVSVMQKYYSLSLSHTGNAEVTEQSSGSGTLLPKQRVANAFWVGHEISSRNTLTTWDLITYQGVHPWPIIQKGVGQGKTIKTNLNLLALIIKFESAHRAQVFESNTSLTGRKYQPSLVRL